MSNEIVIEGLRGVGRVELALRPGQSVYTFFGANGVGKTKCLEAIYQAWLFSNKAWLAAVGGHSVRLDLFVMKSADIGALGGPRLLAVPSTAAGDEPYTSFEYVFRASGQVPHEMPVVLIGAQSRSTMNESNVQHGLIGTFSERKSLYFQKILGAMQSKQTARLGMAEDVQGWFVVRAQSDNPYQKDSDNRRVEIDTLLEVLHEIDGRIEAGSSAMQLDGSGRVSLRVDGQWRGLDELSSGFVSLVKMIQAIVAGYANFTNESKIRQVRGVVLIDEIESHLHAAWQTRIVPKLKQLFPQTTFYVATHSPLVLAQLEEGEGYLLQRDLDGVVRSEEIDSPNRRAFVDVLESAFDVDLNVLKLKGMKQSDQKAAKQALLDLLKDRQS